MASHIEKAQAEADVIDGLTATHPAYEKFALRGILHALIALHEQNESKPTRTRSTTTKADK